MLSSLVLEYSHYKSFISSEYFNLQNSTVVKYMSSKRDVPGSNLVREFFFFFFSFLSFFLSSINKMLRDYLEYCSVFMRGTFCLLPYELRVKLLNNGNVVGLSFGFRAVLTSDHRVAGSNPA